MHYIRADKHCNSANITLIIMIRFYCNRYFITDCCCVNDLMPVDSAPHGDIVDRSGIGTCHHQTVTRIKVVYFILCSYDG